MKSFSIKKAFIAGWHSLVSRVWIVIAMVLTMNFVQMSFNFMNIKLRYLPLKECLLQLYPTTAWLKYIVKPVATIQPHLSLTLVSFLILLIIIGLLCGLLLYIGFIKTLFAIYDKQVVSYRQFLYASFDMKRFMNYLAWMTSLFLPFFVLIMLGVFIVISLGLHPMFPHLSMPLLVKTLLIASFLLLAGWYGRYILYVQFAGFFIIDRDYGFVQAMQQSTKLVSHAMLKVLLFDLAWILIGGLGVITIIGNLIALPLGILASISIYRTLLTE